MFKWDDLLKKERKCEKNFFEELGYSIADDYRGEEDKTNYFLKDYSYIINSSALRRLQDKTQVFPLEKNDFIRTRLTHSLETSDIARKLGDRLIYKLKYPNNLLEKVNNDESKEKIKKTIESINSSIENKNYLNDIPTILASAGLIHDIGNPPFGHFGEDIIKKWFKDNLKNLKFELKDSKEKTSLDNVLCEEMKADFYNFDGNAQALRVLTKLHFVHSNYGMNISYPVLASIIKYPTVYTDFKDYKENGGIKILKKKLGCFYTEQEQFKKISTCLGTDNKRHPLAYLLEIADDIAYTLADIEDAFKKGFVTIDNLESFVQERDFDSLDRKTQIAFKALFHKGIENTNPLYKKNKNYYKDQHFQNWLLFIRDWLEYCAIYSFTLNYEKIMNGNYEHDLIKGTYKEETLSILKKFCVGHIFNNKEILKREIAAESILNFLLDKFISATINYKMDSKTKRDEKMWDLISDNFKQQFFVDIKAIEENKELSDEEKLKQEMHLRIHLALDHICGMTDSYARDLYLELSGIKG